MEHLKALTASSKPTRSADEILFLEKFTDLMNLAVSDRLVSYFLSVRCPWPLLLVHLNLIFSLPVVVISNSISHLMALNTLS